MGRGILLKGGKGMDDHRDILLLERKGKITDKVIPCPFCGERCAVVEHIVAGKLGGNLGEYRVECVNAECFVMPHSFHWMATEQGAILGWNRGLAIEVFLGKMKRLEC